MVEARLEPAGTRQLDRARDGVEIDVLATRAFVAQNRLRIEPVEQVERDLERREAAVAEAELDEGAGEPEPSAPEPLT